MILSEIIKRRKLWFPCEKKGWNFTSPYVDDRGPRECCEYKDGLWTAGSPGPGDVFLTEEDAPWSSPHSCNPLTLSKTAVRPWKWCRWWPVSVFLFLTVSSHKQMSAPVMIFKSIIIPSILKRIYNSCIQHYSKDCFKGLQWWSWNKI